MNNEDEIIKEIPVYLSQVLSEQLYVYQYPVKPQNSDFSKANVIKSQIKPLNQEVKVEFSLDTDSDFYDASKGEDIAIRADGMPSHLSLENNQPNACFASGLMDKQCYTSSRAVELTDTKRYAVAYLHDNELHCTPLQSIVQMRPNFFYFDKIDKRSRVEGKTGKEADDDDEEVKQITVKFARTESDKIKKAREKSFDFFSKRSAEEPWCDTTFYHKTSNKAALERMQLICPNSNNITHSLSLSRDSYAHVLIPPEACNGTSSPLPSYVISRNSLKMLPLLEQCKLLLKEAKMLTFQTLCTRLAQESVTIDNILKSLQQAGVAIRGNWTARSEVLYPEKSLSAINGVPADLMCRGRDYIMYLFSKSEKVDRYRIASVIKLPPEEVKEILLSLAKLSNDGKIWELLLPQDTVFEQKYSDVIQRQQLIWQAKQKQFAEMLEAPSNTGKRQRKRSQRDSFSLSDDHNSKHSTSVKADENRMNGNIAKRPRNTSFSVDGDPVSDKIKSNKLNKKTKLAHKV